ncbi:TetR/AcrR family transcriptional regulator [Rhodoferax sp. U11-2br]|uniref:TetR/AcrR family transcriptional regulator n=1 Tax=Rhodoferax sp. U11-2br TaxID=2838878 RepID=UPI001BE82F3D|nr:TetR/AcrR family transcriptional regulator [Rhodoferax sp. U11-2br]MBT3066676.1 TetR/AcrR family transcriptional regulator [Rhodoferax sp. U11-2br]
MSSSYHHGDLKTALLAYAMNQLENNGLGALSMRDMAKAIDVSHTAAYRHFTDKQALLEAVAVQGFETLRGACEQAVEGAELSPRERLLACGLAYVQFGLDKPKLLTHMFTTAAQVEPCPALSGAGANLFVVLQNLVAQGQSQGHFREEDVRELSYACWAMVHGLAMLLNMDRTRSTPAEPAALMDRAAKSLTVFLDGLCCTETRTGTDLLTRR